MQKYTFIPILWIRPEPNGYALASSNLNQIKNVTPLLSICNLSIPFNKDLIFTSLNNFKDSIDYVAAVKKGYDFGEGYSGAPAFFKIQGKFIFGGLCSSGSHEAMQFLFVKPKYILSKFLKILK